MRAQGQEAEASGAGRGASSSRSPLLPLQFHSLTVPLAALPLLPGTHRPSS